MAGSWTVQDGLQTWLSGVDPAAALAALAGGSGEAAVFVVDRNRNVLLWNDGARRLLGFEPGDVLGQHCLKASRCASCIAGCGLEQYGRVTDVPLTMHRADGGSIRVRKSGTAFFDDQGQFAGGVEVLVREGASERPHVEGLEPEAFHGLISKDPSMQRVRQSIRGVAATDACVLVGGESGTGKELVARAIHKESPRAKQPFVAINCAALVPTLLESELFGHVKGAFTGAIRDREGLLHRADGGTLFLDEVAELSLELQAKLLRVVEKSCFVPVGGRTMTCVDVRLVAATHRSLRREVKAGRFREDLMYRLRVVPIDLPPLRERRGDIELLTWHFIDQRNRKGLRHIDSIDPGAMRALLEHGWAGNVRELQNAVAYAFAVGSGPVLTLQELPAELRGEGERDSAELPTLPKETAVEDEATRIRAALRSCDGHVGRAAALLGMSRPTLWRKRRRHGIASSG